MLFNSLDFAIFTPIVFIIYWLIANINLKFQNLSVEKQIPLIDFNESRFSKHFNDKQNYSDRNHLIKREVKY